MAGLSGRLLGGLRIVASDPVGLARRAWSRKAYTLFRLASLVPPKLRQPIARPVARVAERLVARPGEHRVLPQLAFVARWCTGDRAEAGTLALALATSDRVTVGARRRLAELAINAGLKDAAQAIVDATPDDRSPLLEIVRARLDYDAGRYSAALGHAERAHPSGGEARRLRELAAARLRVLDPTWQPSLAGQGRRLAHLRGHATRGRIAHLLFASLPYHESGYCVRSQFVAHCQRAAGLDPRFITRAGFPRSIGVAGAPSQEVVDGVRYYHLAPDFEAAGRQDRIIEATIRAAVPLLARLRPAAIQPASNHVQAQIAMALAGPLGIPVVYEVRGFWEETWASHPWHDSSEAVTTDHYRLTRETETRAMLAADAVVTLSETMKAAIVERGRRTEDIVVVPNAVDGDQFTPRPRDEALAASLGIEPGEPVVGYVSTFNPYEGIQYLIEAAARLRERGRRVRVLLVGDGIYRDELLATAARLGLDDGTVIMPGRVPHAEVPRYVSILDVFVVPRTADRVSQLVTPLKPFEAMAMARPVVVSDLPAMREIVEPDVTGLMFRAEDPDDLANVLAGLLDDAGLRSRLGGQARELVLANRTWAANGRRYRELYERLGAA
jgi:glycosyltransferase involved in cell wall biosynthesis